MKNWLLCIAVLAAPVESASAHDASGPASEAAPFGPPVDDRHVWYHAMANRLEGRLGANDGFKWDGEAWAGTDSDRLWLKSEGLVNDRGRIEDGRHEIFYDRPLTAFFDLQAGLRSDVDSRAGRSWAALGVEGLAPLFFHVAATGYAGSGGHYAARIEGSYDLLLTQRLILQPQAELNFYSRSDSRRGIGAGLADIDSGLRLRYEFSRKFAPYIGVAYERRFGGTATLARLAGEPVSSPRFTFGLRAWL